MIKKIRFKEFLLLFAKADFAPFSRLEDYFAKEYKAICTPFFQFDSEMQASYESFRSEFSGNLLKLKPKRKLYYINHIKDKIISETFAFNKNELIDYLVTLGVKTEVLDYRSNKKLSYLLHENVVLDANKVDFEKSIKVIRLYYKYLLNIKRDEILNRIDILINDSSDNKTSSEDEYKNTIWFKVGLLFAKGLVQELYGKYKYEKGHFSKITLELGFKTTDRPYFSETINNTTNNTKNIYSDFTKMKKIYDHCVNNKILINEDFMNIFNALQAK